MIGENIRGKNFSLATLARLGFNNRTVYINLTSYKLLLKKRGKRACPNSISK